jgi:hypothetical protein
MPQTIPPAVRELVREAVLTAVHRAAIITVAEDNFLRYCQSVPDGALTDEQAEEHDHICLRIKATLGRAGASHQTDSAIEVRGRVAAAGRADHQQRVLAVFSRPFDAFRLE